jgi:uncharacterized membrane protein
MDKRFWISVRSRSRSAVIGTVIMGIVVAWINRPPQPA